MINNKSTSVRWTAIPVATQILPVWDSTRDTTLGGEGMSPASVATGSSYLVPLSTRGRWGRIVLNGITRCTVQNVTLNFYTRTAYAGASTDWELDTNAPFSGTKVVVAGTTVPWEWTTDGESLVTVTAGATAPTVCMTEFTVSPMYVRGT